MCSDMAKTLPLEQVHCGLHLLLGHWHRFLDVPHDPPVRDAADGRTADGLRLRRLRLLPL